MHLKTNEEREFEDVKRAICEHLELNPNRPPLTLSPQDTATTINQKVTTLAQWRTKKLHNLRYTKMGRHVRYRFNDVVKFVIESTRG